MVEYLKNDFNNVKRRAKLTLVDIHQLIELWVSECYFLCNNLIWKLYNSGPIGLSIWFIYSCDFKIFRKPAITKLQIKSNSNMAPNISVSIFKGFLSRAYKNYLERYIDEEIQF